MVKMIVYTLLFTSILCFAHASTLLKPPQTALVIGFEKVYDLSLLANTLSDQGIDATLIVPSIYSNDVYENLINVEVIKLNFTIEKNLKNEDKALKACEVFLSDKKIHQTVIEIAPTFTIFPAVRHDACLIPWTLNIDSIPVIWADGYEEELYVIHNSKMAIPIYTSGVIERFWSHLNMKTEIANIEGNYVFPAIKITQRYLSHASRNLLDEWYSDVKLFLWGSDPVVRLNFAPLTHRLVEIGCHHCRGVQPLPPALQKDLVEFRLGTIVVTLEDNHFELITKIAERLPQGRQGQAVAWKTRASAKKKPENLFLHQNVDRQDLIGYVRARAFLSHCSDIELLEAAFHGTPILCFPRNTQETKNALRAVELGFSVLLNDDYSIDNVYKAIEELSQVSSYREFAKKISLALRDRIVPASDKINFWLSYTARNKETAVNYWPVGKGITIRTFDEDVKFFYGLLIGIIFGALFTITTVLTWYYQRKESKMNKMKGKKHTR
ncbi:2-hydroxyacylsphingosine 1-beta-galactosyltransferase-like [Chelonus insularis]|uniref:2-hydroxyacylsphingosine 1-beta-galactosyltransferase-like n=1 Tax=Chelonus insularis TaxID=460826 RepID=UPI00158E74E9|nr:2-hydroxyacylsphingosine 1-beta-galactosyltransferase-like [Chelonus insularis]